MQDPTEGARRKMVAEINANAGSRETLEAQYGRVWDTQELGRDFEVHSFAAPFVLVTRKSDGTEGGLTFQHWPRLYFDFHADGGAK